MGDFRTLDQLGFFCFMVFFVTSSYLITFLTIYYIDVFKLFFFFALYAYVFIESIDWIILSSLILFVNVFIHYGFCLYICGMILILIYCLILIVYDFQICLKFLSSFFLGDLFLFRADLLQDNFYSHQI